jgi:hypothetical protein
MVLKNCHQFDKPEKNCYFGKRAKFFPVAEFFSQPGRIILTGVGLNTDL